MRRVTWICMMSLSALVGGCGNDAGFSGESGKQRSSSDAESVPPPSAPQTPAEPFSSLTWFWQCDSSPITLPDDGADKPVVEGAGPHNFDPNKVNGTPITFSGHLCQPREIPRDIVFVVDVSGSMTLNDPRINGTCGRRTAIESVVNTITNGNARFGIVTYASGLSRSSSMLVDNQASLYADIAPLGNVGNTVCADAGGTNYDAGLSRAAELLRSGRPNATKEIYFISDGEPDAGRNGVAIANSLKTVGIDVGGTIRPVTIATIMLAGTDTVLEQAIASKDAAGVPMHVYVSQTAQLEKVLADLSNNEIIGGELRYRVIGASDFTVVNLLDHLQGFDFVLPSITIDVQTDGTGLEVEYEYWDKHDNRYVTGGKLLWTAVSSGGS